jgi:MFS family permease
VALLSGLLFTATAGGAAIGNHLCAWLLARKAPATVVAGGSMAAAAALGAFLAATGPWAMAALLTVFGVAVGTAVTAAYTIGGRSVPASMHATGFGFLTGASLAGLALSPVVAGVLSKGSLLAVFAVDAVMLALAAAAVFRWRPARPRGGDATDVPASASDAI